jgi:LL-diaminopimelate aminotransferase
MKIRPSRRLLGLDSAIFTEMNSRKREVEARGTKVIDLGIGSPDLPPSPEIRKALEAAVGNPKLYGYPTSEGTLAFRQEVAAWYQYRFGVELDAEKEVLTLMGSQDGLAHLATALIDPGDVVLVPDPGYPIYAASIVLAGGDLMPMPLREENEFLPDLEAIPVAIAERAKIMILNYPSNPVSAVADLAFFEKAAAFARKYEILVVHDFAYSEMTFDGYEPPSFLEVAGAKEFSIEFHSLSKSFNMAGCRLAFAIGNAEALKALSIVKSNIDYGVFLAVQQAGIAALQQDRRRSANERPPASIPYEKRRDVFIPALREMGWEVTSPKATMFLWARVPNGWTSMKFAMELLERAGVVVIPGSAFGAEGEGYVRMALVHEEEVLLEVVQRIRETGIFSS